MAKQGIYRGYSSFEYQKNKSFKINDIEAVKLDLLNHIFTRRGERVMMPRFGTRIPDLAFEPLDDITLLLLEEDLRQVVAFDPRVELLTLQLAPNYEENSVVARMRLQYVELNTVDSLDINITFEGI
jgi:phage baseplate assembly protein W